MQQVNNNYKIVDYTWIDTLAGLIGIVVVENKIQHQICYIGIVPEKKSDLEDAQQVVNYGAVFPMEAARYYFPYLENKF